MSKKKIVYNVVRQYKICASCGCLKHWWAFRRPYPGGILPMGVFDDCNLCSKLESWKKGLSPRQELELQHKVELEDILEEEAEDECDFGVCELCGFRAWGQFREHFNTWVCNPCFWNHCYGRKLIN